MSLTYASLFRTVIILTIDCFQPLRAQSSLEVFKNQCNFPKFLMLNSSFDFFCKIHSKIFRKDLSFLSYQAIRHIMETSNEIK